MSDDREDVPTEPPAVPPAERPKGLVGWFAAAIGEALTAAFGIAIALVGGIFKALLSPTASQEDDDSEG